MKKLTTFPKIFAVIALSAEAIWLGSYLTRLVVAYHLFDGPDLNLQAYITDQNANGILLSLMPVILTHIITYVLMILAFIIFLVSSRLSLKQNGWLFIILVLVVITSPFEIYLMTIDFKTVSLLMNSTFDPNIVINLLRKRIQVLSSYPIVEVLCYLSFFYFIIFQPLTKIDKKSA